MDLHHGAKSETLTVATIRRTEYGGAITLYGTEQHRIIYSFMNISWNDLNNVQEAGEYPFRDGTIAVTFSEVAIWKKNPEAQFQLMRKHPVRDVSRYVLGKQIERRFPPSGNEFIYESSNGDAWFLTRDDMTGTRAVMHRPNPQSGGQVSFIDIEKFLSDGANGPEHQALRRLMETSGRVAILLIACDIHSPRSDSFANFVREIQTLGEWWHHLETIWIVQCAFKPFEVRDRLKPHLGADDQLLVVDITGDTAEWDGINDAGSNWLGRLKA